MLLTLWCQKPNKHYRQRLYLEENSSKNRLKISAKHIVFFLTLQISHIYENQSSPNSKNKINQNGENSKENCDSNKQYLISDNSQSAINPLTKSREDLTLIARAYFELYQKNLYDAAEDVSGDNRK